ncbi:MAG: hypothetical protein IKI73_00820 [Firmicutes bacterium]|nr:hypothetical protein [Bacillota bacterium]
MKKIKLKKFFFNPPGIDIGVMIGLLFLIALIFILIVLSNTVKESIWTTPLDAARPYSELLEGKLFGFWVYAAACAALAAANYRSFSSQSRSLYVMKRAGSAFEMHRMCLTVPLIGLIAGLLLTYLIVAAYKAEYIRIFQQYNIPAGYSDFNFWRALI